MNAPDHHISGAPTLAAIVGELEEDIVLGFLHPKERLVEDDLMQRFGVKRHVIRAALAELVKLGIVEHRKNVGAVVRSYNYKEVADLYEMRDLLEGEAARRMACPADPDDVGRLRALQAAHDAAVQAGDPRRIFKTNMAFHAALFALCPNTVLAAAIRYHYTQTHAIRYASATSPQAQQRSRQEHHGIIDALAQGDRKTLVRLCREHIRPARDEYLSMNRHYLG
ncbi:FCD domain-containing protein [Pusillimonas sp. TS35]|uniref:GntR family transcriptional regulator n=1 Tax=Paracandidimonas lactea TaxID=2895524 RepID=UPI00136BC1E6|nr:GntR family transcriptional regulator [Paracandidimonas lactea]MYN11585.1 FCD domain-containing protein [Pusillimonas sp. TS35]